MNIIFTHNVCFTRACMTKVKTNRRLLCVGVEAIVIPCLYSDKAFDIQWNVPSEALTVINLFNDIFLKGSNEGEYVISTKTSANLTGGLRLGGYGKRKVLSSPEISLGIGGILALNPPISSALFSKTILLDLHSNSIEFIESKLSFRTTKGVINARLGSSDVNGVMESLGEKA